MRSNLGGWFAVALVGFPVAGCVTPGKVDLGGNSDGGSEAGTSWPPYSKTIDVQGCDGDPANDPAFLGQGLIGFAPGECNRAAGPAHAVTSIAEMTQLLVGTWFGCEHSLFGVQLDPPELEDGVELTSDGQYTALGQNSSFSLVPLDPRPDAGPSDPNAVGTWTVADGSATYGPGTYELQIRPGGGGLYRGQVTVTDSPLQMHFSAVNTAEIVFAPPAPWSPRKGVCTCLNKTGTKVSPDDPVGLQQAMIGRWIWCGTDNPPPGFLAGPYPTGVPMGVEFTGNGTWYALEEWANGELWPGGGGTLKLVPASSLSASLPPMAAIDEPLALLLTAAPTNTGQLTVTQVVVTENPRALLLGAGSTGGGTGPDGWVPFYTVMFPIP
jgi:hypothetical protein